MVWRYGQQYHNITSKAMGGVYNATTNAAERIMVDMDRLQGGNLGEQLAESRHSIAMQEQQSSWGGWAETNPQRRRAVTLIANRGMQALAAYNNRSNPTEELGYTDTFEIN
jgi:hypothetical protein